jgi:nucleoside-diphosphate-sugar epimerase
MKVLVAGASGVMGKQLLPRLVVGGHQVVGMTRSAARWGGPAAGRRGGRGDDDRGEGASNAKAKRELGWQPQHPSWRQGIGAE